MSNLSASPGGGNDRPPDTPMLYFGQHKGQPLSAIPTGYLRWCLETVKLSSGVRVAVAAELTSRNVPVPPQPLPTVPPCRRCAGSFGYVCHWRQDRLGRKSIRAECPRCRGNLTTLPTVEPYVSEANEAASPSPILDALTRLEDLGVELESNGVEVFIRDAYRRVPPDLMAVVRQCNHDLAVMLGRTVRGGR